MDAVKLDSCKTVKPAISPDKIYRGGRKKGSKNKIQRDLKEDILRVFRRMGGVRAMLTWAKENQSEFYTRVVPRMIPVTANVNATLEAHETHHYDFSRMTLDEKKQMFALMQRAKLAPAEEQKN